MALESIVSLRKMEILH